MGEIKRFFNFFKRLFKKVKTDREEIRDGLTDALKIIALVEAGGGSTNLTTNAKRVINDMLYYIDVADLIDGGD